MAQYLLGRAPVCRGSAYGVARGPIAPPGACGFVDRGISLRPDKYLWLHGCTGRKKKNKKRERERDGEGEREREDKTKKLGGFLQGFWDFFAGIFGRRFGEFLSDFGSKKHENLTIGQCEHVQKPRHLPVLGVLGF